MTFNRDALTDIRGYFESVGLTLKGSRNSKWLTTRCDFHNGSDSMRVNIVTGSFKCMNCQIGGGDVLAFEMSISGCDFQTAAKRLGMWIDDGKSKPKRRSNLSTREAIYLMSFEGLLIGIEGARIAAGSVPTPSDLERVLEASRRVSHIAEAFR